MDIVAFSIGGLPVYWYGLIVAGAIVAGLAVTAGNLYLRREKFSPAVDLLIFGIPTGLVFARLFYVVLHWSFYQNNLWQIFMLQQGGLSIYGAFFGFMLTVFAYTRHCNLRFWHWLDLLTPAFVLGIAIDQLGHFIFQATVGMPLAGDVAAQRKIAEYVEYACRPSGFEGYEYFQPVALYQFVWQMLIFAGAAALSLRQIYCGARLEGALFLRCMILVCLGRFWFGFFYLTANPGGDLHFAQLLSLAGMLLCAGILALWRFRPRRNSSRRIWGR